MGLKDALRRFSRIAPPQVIVLAEEEMSWPSIKALSVSVPTIEPPDLSRDLVLTRPKTAEIACLSQPEVVEVDGDASLPAPEVVHLLDLHLLVSPAAYGTIYVKKTEEARRRGQSQIKTRVEPFHLSRHLDPRKPVGLDIFELLLPILMPPAATEFRDELLFPGELYPFQRAGVKFLFDNDSALLADDMGLGKTVQAITAFRALIRRSLALQALVVCPKGVLANWMHELSRWAPELVVVRVHGDQRGRGLAWRAYVGKCHALVTTYETVRQDQAAIRGRAFDLVIADEVQRIKNPNAAVSRAVRSLNAQRRWGLTGTPLENKLEDMVAVFEFIKPGLFQAREVPYLSPQAVRERTRPYVLRRRKEEALPELPDKVVDTKWLELTESQRMAYDRAEREGTDRLRQTPDVTVQHVLALIQRVKQICNFDPETGESAKLEFLLQEYLPEACQDDSKVLVISQYVKTIQQLEHELKDYRPLLYTGQLSTAQRTQVEEAFALKDEHKILLLSLRAGGVGLNLTRANYVVHFDRWWNPAVERQAEDRTHRIGQRKTVFVTRLICQGTIEERIEQLLEKKKILFHEVVDELADVALERVLSEEELFGLFGLTSPRRASMAFPEAAPEHVPQTPAEERRAIVIKPEEPFSNVVSLRRILRESEEFIWWADKHFHVRALEELIDTIDPAVVRQVRILSGPANVNDRAKRDFARFREEVQRKGISAEWRVLPDFAHDRFIISKNACYNVPPVNSLLRGSYAEILDTPNRPPFEDWWGKGTPLEDVHQEGPGP